MFIKKSVFGSWLYVYFSFALLSQFYQNVFQILIWSKFASITSVCFVVQYMLKLRIPPVRLISGPFLYYGQCQRCCKKIPFVRLRSTLKKSQHYRLLERVDMKNMVIVMSISWLCKNVVHQSRPKAQNWHVLLSSMFPRFRSCITCRRTVINWW